HGRVGAQEVRAHLRAARVSAVPSRWYENQPLSVLEAFASGVPVVGSALGGLTDLITPSVDGALVPAEDALALAAALRPYLADAELSLRQGAAARERALARHEPVAHAARIEEIYAAAISAQAAA
ncbi:MAG: glycosyltransferase, partial [Nostocoides sp.]